MPKIILKHDPNAMVSHRGGFGLLHDYLERIGFDHHVNKTFGAPGSNRGYDASAYVRTLVELCVDGHLALEDVQLLREDSVFKILTDERPLPSSDAIGDWLRRQGGDADKKENPGEALAMRLIKQHLDLSLQPSDKSVLDIDASILECDKADATWTYKGVRGYQPMLAILEKPTRVVCSEFRNGNESPQAGLTTFLKRCLKQISKEQILSVRSDSAAYQSDVFNFCFDEKLYFSITADQDSAVKALIKKIPVWHAATLKDGSKAPWEYAEEIHCMNETKEAFRLIIKRSKRKQPDLLEGEYTHWCIATNLPEETYNANDVILHHQERGNMERFIGELKSHYNLDTMPCGQLKANAVYFAIGLLTFNLMQHLQEIVSPHPKVKPSMRSLRRYLFHLPTYITRHARTLTLYITASSVGFELLKAAYAALETFHPPNFL